MSDPDVSHARQALAGARDAGRAGHLPDRDRLPRRRDPAGVGVSRKRPARSPTPIGWCSSAGRRSTRRATRGRISGSSSTMAQAARSRLAATSIRSEVFEEMRQAMPSIAGITWDRLERESRRHLPVRARRRSGQRASCSPKTFPTGDRQRDASSRPQIIPAAERPDAEYPFVLITGRQLEHWHTGSMTRRTEVLDAIEPAPVASFNPDGPRGARRRAGRCRSRSRRAAAAVSLCRARRRRHAARRGRSFRSATTRPRRIC